MSSETVLLSTWPFTGRFRKGAASARSERGGIGVVTMRVFVIDTLGGGASAYSLNVA